MTDIPNELLQDCSLSYGALGVLSVLMVEGAKFSDIQHLMGNRPDATRGRSILMQSYFKEIEDAGHGHLLDKIGLRKASSEMAFQARKLMLGQPEKECEWCERSCHRLIKHHYPIPYKNGGTETVEICGTCHEDFHYFEGKLAKESGIHVNQQPRK
jgi:hypothetical protein